VDLKRLNVSGHEVNAQERVASVCKIVALDVWVTVFTK